MEDSGWNNRTNMLKRNCLAWISPGYHVVKVYKVYDIGSFKRFKSEKNSLFSMFQVYNFHNHFCDPPILLNKF